MREQNDANGHVLQIVILTFLGQNASLQHNTKQYILHRHSSDKITHKETLDYFRDF